MKRGQQHERYEFASGVAFGHCKTWIDFYSEGNGLAASELTIRVGTLLLSAQGGKVHGAAHSLPSLRRTSATRDKATRTLALVGSSRGKAQVARKKVVWTAARRREYADRMRRNQAMLQRARRAA